MATALLKEKLDKQHRYPWAVIETAVQLYTQQTMTYRAISDKLASHGVDVSHKTVYEWVQKFSDKVRQKPRKRLIKSYDVEESYIKCNGHWMYMYRAADKKKSTLSIYLREKKNLTSAKSFFKKNIEI